MLIMKKILSVVGIIGGTFFLLVAAICVEEWFSNPAYAADMEISGLIMCIVLGIFGVILIVLGIQTLRLQKLYREYKEIAETSNDGFIPDMAAILNQPEDKVRRNLEKLCKKKYFNDAYVDNKAKLFVRKDQMSQKIGNPSFTKTVKQTDAELVTVKCRDVVVSTKFKEEPWASVNIAVRRSAGNNKSKGLLICSLLGRQVK